MQPTPSSGAGARLEVVCKGATCNGAMDLEPVGAAAVGAELSARGASLLAPLLSSRAVATLLAPGKASTEGRDVSTCSWGRGTTKSGLGGGDGGGGSSVRRDGDGGGDENDGGGCGDGFGGYSCPGDGGGGGDGGGVSVDAARATADERSEALTVDGTEGSAAEADESAGAGRVES